MMQGSLAERLRVLRARRGFTLTEAAERAGVQRQTLALLERGERHPHTPTLHKIANGYGVPVEDLLVEPVLVGKAEAPEAGLPAQERREQLRNIRKWLVDAHEILEGSFKGYRTAGDGRRLVGLTSLAVLRACFKTAQPPLGLRVPIGQLRVPIGQRRSAVAMQASSEAVLKRPLSAIGAERLAVDMVGPRRGPRERARLQRRGPVRRFG